jgi:hypothetical protein
MRVRVSLDFDILIECFISLCIMETVGVGVDVLYRRAIRTSCILPVKSFSRPRVL